MQVTVACVGTVLATLALALPAAYAFDRFEFPFRRTLLLWSSPRSRCRWALPRCSFPNYIYFTRLGLTNRGSRCR